MNPNSNYYLAINTGFPAARVVAIDIPSGLISDSPAVKAGLKPNDLVSFVDGEPTVSIKMFQEMMKKTRPGTTLRIEVRRGDSLQTIELKLEDYPKTATTQKLPANPPKP